MQKGVCNKALLIVKWRDATPGLQSCLIPNDSATDLLLLMLAFFVSWGGGDVDDDDDDDHGFHNSGLDHRLNPLQEAKYARHARRLWAAVQRVQSAM